MPADQQRVDLYGLNNLKINSITSKTYAEYFGFTQEEVEQILRDYGLEDNLENVRKWYGGYFFGENEVYNPWSVLNYVNSCHEDKDAPAKPYWFNTSSNSIIEKAGGECRYVCKAGD